ncbi:response regulator transcription factor, partial [Aeromonas media]|uniref:response regulator transcription factor n=1 Tax=Aeromonas media TaxID=651 RepID=UPI001F11D162
PPLYLVDDDQAVLDSLRFMLESCDERQLRCFADGERFLEEVDLRLPACLILDCRMPGLSGPEVQQQLKAAQSPIAILFLTGHGEVPLAVESLKQGAVDFLQKPVQLAPLLAAIERAEQGTLAAA